METPLPTARRSLKHNLEHDLTEDQTDPNVQHLDFKQLRSNFSAKILQQISLLNSPDQAVVNNAILVLEKNVWWNYCVREDLMDTIVRCGAVPALVRHLRASDDASDSVSGPYQHEVEKGCAYILGLVAIRPAHQQLIIDAGALPCLIDLLRRHKISTISQQLIDLLKRVVDAINNLAHENTIIKTLVRMEGGIPLLVELLEFNATEIQRAAVMALGTLAFNNDENIKQIVECNALPTLVLMLRSEDPTIQYLVVDMIKNLLNSLPDIKKEVLLAGVVQPVICLLSSCCLKSQRVAAFLLGQFAATNSDCKVHISQRGAIPPLVDMLKSPNAQLRETSVFTLGKLVQDSHNQAGIAHNGGIEPLLNLLDSNNTAPVQQYAAFALCCLANNEDVVADIIKAGVFQKLKDGHFKDQGTKEYVAILLKILEKKMQGRVLKHLIYLMRFAEKGIQSRVAIALACLCSPRDCKTIFIDNNGLELLLDMLESSNVKQKGDASATLHKLAAKASSFVSLFGVASPSPTPKMYLGEEYVNNAKLSDVTFLVEGGASATIILDIFQIMFDDSYREREAKHVVIPNIKWDVFELMMRFIYTGTVDVNLDIAQDLLRAANQYLLDGLKRICEHVILQDISVENVAQMYKMSEDFNATTLKHACILFMLEKFDELRSKQWYCPLVCRIVPDIRMFFSTLLTSLVKLTFEDS